MLFYLLALLWFPSGRVAYSMCSRWPAGRRAIHPFSRLFGPASLLSCYPCNPSCFFNFPSLAAVLSFSSPHRVMVCLAHHKAHRVLPTIVCAVRPVMLCWFVFGRTHIAGLGGRTGLRGSERPQVRPRKPVQG